MHEDVWENAVITYSQSGGLIVVDDCWCVDADVDATSVGSSPMGGLRLLKSAVRPGVSIPFPDMGKAPVARRLLR